MAPKTTTPITMITDAVAKAVAAAQLEILEKVVEMVSGHIDDDIMSKLTDLKTEITESSKVKTKKTRARTDYHEFLSSKMIELKDTEPALDSKERLKRAQELYREFKAENTSNSESEVVPDNSDSEEKKNKEKKSKKSKKVVSDDE